jgi:thioredoxin 1
MVTELGKDWDAVLSQERIAVVKCYGTWCGPCKFFTPHFNRYSNNFKVYNDTEIKYYQSDNDKLPDLKAKYGVTVLPTTLFLVHGILVKKVQGITRQSVFEEMLSDTLNVKFHVRPKGE